MRRSAAPSQTGIGGLAKRQKFVSPVSNIADKINGHSTNLISVRQSQLNKETSESSSVFLTKQCAPSLFKHVIRSTNDLPTLNVKYNTAENKEWQIQSDSDNCESRPQEEVAERDPATIFCKPIKTSLICSPVLSEEHGSSSDTPNKHYPGQLDKSVMSLSGPATDKRTTTEQLFLTESPNVPILDNPQHHGSHCIDVSNKTVTTRYFSAVWCKMSKKKHKKWEGDAILTTSGRTAILYDMDGKIIGRGSGYKMAELESLADDETLFVGGKEIQVLAVLTEDYFKSGKCFTSTIELSPSTDGHSKVRHPGISKPFVNPSLKSGQANTVKRDATDKLPVTLKHDPNTPNALVMPRPSAEHQWKHNRQGRPITDVVVDPYLSNYLRSHQRAGVIFLYECVLGMKNYQGQGAILADDMGLGKTLQCICLIWTLLKQGPYGGSAVAKKVLIVTPGSLVKNWFLEFKKWLGTERLSVFAVSADKRADEFVKSSFHPVLLISYEMFVRCYELIKQVPFDLIICDEGHRLKNTAIKTTSLLMSLPCRRRIVLTGTPVQNDLQEFYSIVEFCNPGILGSSAAFRHIYEDPIITSRQPEVVNEHRELGLERAQELTRLTQMFVLRRTQEINNDYLPSKVEMVLFCKPSLLQLNLYRQLIHSNLVRRCLLGNLSGSPHLLFIGALKHLCNHPGLIYRKAAEEKLQREEDNKLSVGSQNGGSLNDFEDSIYSGLLLHFPETYENGSLRYEDSGKLMVLSEILSAIWSQSASEKVVLVSNHTKVLDILEVFCNMRGYSFLRLDGQTPTAQRQDIVSRFNSKFSPFRIFLLSSKAGGVGLNLVGASRLILYDIDWNPANDLQAMARVWRDGQTEKVYIYRLLTVGTIEEKMYQRQITKQGLSGAVMDLSRKNSVQFSLEDLKDLFSLNEGTDCETHSMLGCRCCGDPSYIQEETEADGCVEERKCQLGGSSGTIKKKKVSNLTMAELSRWKHWRGEFVTSQKNWCLHQAGSSLCFVLWNETNTG